MPEYVVKIQSIQPLTHNVKQFRTTKPADYAFQPGQATEVSINQKRWLGENRPFTFTSLPTADYLEFIIKAYTDHDGVTKALHQLNVGDEIVVRETWGAFGYRGPGLFIAGGAGITPFLAIARDLASRGQVSGNRLLFANKTEGDIILRQELLQIFGANFANVLSEQISKDFFNGYVTDELVRHFLHPATDWAYICGPDPFVESVVAMVERLGLPANRIVRED